MPSENRNKLKFLGLVVGFSLFACTFLGGENGETSAPEPSPSLILSPTPNLTLTAVFAPTATSPSDSQGGEPTDPSTMATASPTGSKISVDETAPPTLAPPTSTLIPVATITPIYLDFPAEETTTAADVRPGPSVVAVHQAVPPIIDGDIGDWPLPMYAMDSVVKGTEYYANIKDLFGEFKVGWDMQYLYIGVIVRDTSFVQTAGGFQLYQGDSLEILIDADLSSDFNDSQLNSDDFQIGISPGNLLESPNAEAYLWTPRDRAGKLETVLIGARLTDDGYMMEVAFPWVELGVLPFGGQHLGFLLSVSDNDSVNDNVQQSVISFAPERLLHDPTSWRDLVLQNP